MKKNNIFKTLIVTTTIACATQPISAQAGWLTDSFTNIKILFSNITGKMYQHKTATIVSTITAAGLIAGYFAWHKQKTAIKIPETKNITNPVPGPANPVKNVVIKQTPSSAGNNNLGDVIGEKKLNEQKISEKPLPKEFQKVIEIAIKYQKKAEELNNIISSVGGWIEVKNFDVNEISKPQPLIIAVAHEYTDMVNYLLKEGADPNIFDDANYYDDEETKTPLIIAVEKGNLEIIKLLVENGPKSANLELYEENATTPLQAATNGGHIEIIKYLIGRGAKPGTPEIIDAAGVVGRLDLVVYFYNLLLNDYTKKYKEQKEKYNKKMHHLVKVIMWEAVAYGRKEIFKFCLQHGGKFDHKNSFLHMAVDLAMNNLGQHALTNGNSLSASNVSADFVKFLIKESGVKVTKEVAQHITNDYDWHNAPAKAIELKNYVLKMYQQPSKEFAKVSSKAQGPSWLRKATTSFCQNKIVPKS